VKTRGCLGRHAPGTGAGSWAGTCCSWDYPTAHPQLPAAVLKSATRAVLDVRWCSQKEESKASRLLGAGTGVLCSKRRGVRQRAAACFGGGTQTKGGQKVWRTGNTGLCARGDETNWRGWVSASTFTLQLGGGAGCGWVPELSSAEPCQVLSSQAVAEQQTPCQSIGQ